MCQFDSKLIVLFSLTTVAGVICSDYQKVKEYDVDYSCCNPLPIPPKEHCEQIWHFEEEPIAYIDASHKDCTDPCQKDGDMLKIHGCVDCTAHNVCENGSFISEEIIHYKAQPCPESRSSQTRPQPQGLVGLLLVALLIIGFFTN